MKLSYQTAIVTGASSGIGAELALQLAAGGVRVGLTARQEEALQALAERIRAQGGFAAVAPADASDPGATRHAIDTLAAQLGHVDLLVANAGRGGESAACRFDATLVAEILQVNVIGAACAIEAVLPGMLERGSGQLVGISSLASYRGLPRLGGYCASKAALNQLLEALRVELRGRGITVTTVYPGYVRTPMTEGSKRPQPFLMEPDRAAGIIVRGIAAKRAEVRFPRRAALLMQLIRQLPDAVYDPLAARFFGVR